MKTGRTKSDPSVNQTFLERICNALDEPPRILAANIGVTFDELEPLLDARHLLAEIDRDDVWQLIEKHVAQRVGALMAIQYELKRALALDKDRRRERIARHNELPRRRSPRS